jgi:ATP-dependent Clp protease adaptor protein ClpS
MALNPKYTMSTQPFVEQEQEVLLAEKEVEQYNLIVWNDEVNTFDFVIETLIKVCKHEPLQAEQCTLIIHFKGKCDVKTGSFKQLKPLAEAIIDRGINATIE